MEEGGQCSVRDGSFSQGMCDGVSSILQTVSHGVEVRRCLCGHHVNDDVS